VVTEELLTALAGESTAEKGRSLYKKGNVTVTSTASDLATDKGQISATVAGSQTYQVSITNLRSPQLKFSCTCPAFDYQPVCKHCVAVGLAAIALNNNEPLPDASSPNQKTTKTKRANNTNTSNNDEILKAYLTDLPKSQLESELYQLVSHDRNQYKSWVAKAKLASEPVSVKHLQKQITKALPLKSLWEYNKVFQYFQHAESLFNELLLSAQQLTPDEQIKLIYSVHKRLDKVFEKLDDSGGYRFGLQAQLNHAMDAAVNQMQLEPEAKADWLLNALQIESDYMPAIPDDFTLNDDEMSLFLAKCMEKFDNLPVADTFSQRTFQSELWQLARILDEHLPANTPLSTRIKIKEKSARNSHDLLAICQLCLQHNDEFLAEDWLLRSKPHLENARDTKQWQETAIAVYKALEQPEKAWDVAWQRFKSQPIYAGWEQLQQQAKYIGWQPDNYLSAAEKLLSEKLEKSSRHHLLEDDMPRFYLNTQQPEKAIAILDSRIADKPEEANAAKTNSSGANSTKAMRRVVGQKQPDRSIFGEAAIQLSPSHPEQAFTYARIYLDNLLMYTSNQRYQDCLTHLTKLNTYLPKTAANTQAFTSFVEELAGKYANRKKLLEMLRGTFGHKNRV